MDKLSQNKFICIDPSFINKSGKRTLGLSLFWSGVAGSVKQGLEITGIAAVDVENKTALHLESIQTPAHCDLEKESITLLDWYAKLITDGKDDLSKI